MGASASTSYQHIKNNLITNASNKCLTGSAINAANIHGLNFTQPPGCPPDSGFNINQTATVDSTCLLSNLQSSAAQLASQLSSQARAGIGIAVSTNVSDIESSIQQNVANLCKTASSTNTANITDTTIDSCNFVLTQNASQKQSCEINNTQKVVDKISAKVSTSATGGSLFGDLFGGVFGGGISSIISIVVVVVILVAIGGVVYHFVGGKKKPEEHAGKKKTKGEEEEGEEGEGKGEGEGEGKGEGKGEGEEKKMNGGFLNFFNDMNNPTSFNKKINKNISYAILIVLIVLVIVVYIIGTCKDPDKQLTNNDLANLNQKISEAQHVAGIYPKNNISSSTIDYHYQHNPNTNSCQTELPKQSCEKENMLDNFYKPLL